MDLVESTNEDVLVLQTENGEQIALPMSALPSDFVPGDSGQIIMVESALDEQQEVVVEASSTEAIVQGTTKLTNDLLSVGGEVAIIGGDKTLDDQQEQEAATIKTELEQQPPPAAVVPVVPKVPHKKQKRKETLVTRTLNEEDMELQFLIIEEPIMEAEVPRKPRKQYRTKKRLAMEKSSKEKQPTKKDTTTTTTAATTTTTTTTTLPSPAQPSSPAKPDPSPQMSERRTRPSNSCRVATGKSYKCQGCDFSTDRINNMILHLKESCCSNKINSSTH